MNKARVTHEAIRFAQEKLSAENTGHDWWHIERVLNIARAICQKEKADWFIVELAVVLHDIGDRKVIDTKDNDYTIARKFLLDKKVPIGTIEEIMFIIENMSFSHTLNTKLARASKEFYVVQDADRLDAMGAIGIARAFAYGGKKGRPLHDPNKKAQKLTTQENFKNMDSSTINHFHEKLFLLKDLLNTKTAKKIAGKRHAFMEKYVKEFLQEWDGKR